MEEILLKSNKLQQYFVDKEYTIVTPHNVVNNQDTVFVTAGIQSLISDFLNNRIDSKKNFISQPVIRTQFINSIEEGISLAFVNLTTSGFNITEREHNLLIKDWIELFEHLGVKKEDILISSKDYARQWGDLKVTGEKSFYYYKNIELGDATFFTKVIKDGEDVGIDTMSDVGFGLERLRWCLCNKQYFDLYKDSSDIAPAIKAYISAMALLLVNDVKPVNKSSGYRMRLLSKKLVELLKGVELTKVQEDYLIQSIAYWKDWQAVNKEMDMSVIEKEYIRNCNRYIINALLNEGYENISGININVSTDEFIKKLHSANVEYSKISEYIKRSR